MDREGTLNIEIHPQPFSGSALVRDYLNGLEPARGFYPAHPFRLASFRDKLEEVQRRFGRPERETAARALRPLSPRARARLQHFVEHGGAVITTGQQAGLLTGPLYTIYKALTVARLAATLEQRLGVTVLPVFWTASEDHDWAEVNHTYLPVPGAELRRVELAGPAEPPLPMSLRLVGEGGRAVLDEVAQVLKGQSFADDVLEWIREAYRPEHSVGEAFASLLGRILEPFDFCLTDAAAPELKQASAGVLARAMEGAEAQEAVLRERVRQLEAAGYHGQVAVVEGATNVFYHGPQGRERIFRRAGGYVAREAGLELDAAGLEEEIRRQPDLFSPNVLLRPVVESAVFPTLAYVGGPGELAYFAQVCALFPEFGIQPPVVYPRGSAVLVEPAMRRLLERLGLELAELPRPRHELVHELAGRAVPPTVRTELDELSAAVAEGYRRLMEAATPVDATLARTLGSHRNRALEQVAESERKVMQQLKRKEQETIAQLDRLRANLWPEGKPQDRVLNVVPFVARFGLELLRDVADALVVPLDEGAVEVSVAHS